jgi:multidrug efflux pump subunit AcrA (membrane-fusion protein)
MVKHNAYKCLRALPNTRKIFKITTAIFIVTLFFFLFVPWQQFALGNGKVIAFSPNDRQQPITAPIDGRIKKWHVNEGQTVKKGDIIVEITDNDPKLVERLRLEKAAVLRRIKGSEQALQASESNLKRQKILFEEGIQSKRTYELAQIEYAKYQNELATANIDLLNIDVRLARQSTQLVKADMDGMIIRRMSGQESLMVTSGAILAEIIPETGSRAVQLWIHGNDIPFVRINQKARLQFEGWPAVQFRGWPEIAVGTFEGQVTFIDATDNGQGLFRVVILPIEKWPEHQFLRQGVRVHGWVQLGRVPLWYELWRQYNGFPPESDGDVA